MALNIKNVIKKVAASLLLFCFTYVVSSVVVEFKYFAFDTGHDSGFPLLISNWMELILDIAFWYAVIIIYSKIFNKYKQGKSKFELFSFIFFSIFILVVIEFVALWYFYPESYIMDHAHSGWSTN